MQTPCETIGATVVVSSIQVYRMVILVSQGQSHSPKQWLPTDEEKEAKAMAEMHKRKPCPTRRQGNRWDQYGESSSAASSEAHGMSDSMYTESTWGPCESASKSQ